MPSTFATQGQTFSSTQDYAGAIRAFAQGLKAAPKDADCAVGLARAYLALGDDEAAQRSFHVVVALKRDVAEAHAALALLEVRSGAVEALPRLAMLSAQHPSNPRVVMARVAAEECVGNFSVAIELVGKLARLAPRDVEVALLEARVTCDWAQPAQALAAAKRACALAPRDWHAALLLARAMERTGDVAGARKHLADVLARFPSTVEVATTVFEATAHDAPQLALSAATRLRQLLPKKVRPLVLEGMALIGLGRRAEAKARFTQATQLAPDAAEPKHALASCLIQEGALAEAQTLLEHAVRLEPASPAAANTLALLLLQQQRAADAVTLLSRIKRAHPSDATTQLNLALAHGQLEQYERALERLDDVDAARGSAPEAQCARLRKLFSQAKARMVASTVDVTRRAHPTVEARRGPAAPAAPHLSPVRQPGPRLGQGAQDGARRAPSRVG